MVQANQLEKTGGPTNPAKFSSWSCREALCSQLREALDWHASGGFAGCKSECWWKPLHGLQLCETCSLFSSEGQLHVLLDASYGVLLPIWFGSLVTFAIPVVFANILIFLWLTLKLYFKAVYYNHGYVCLYDKELYIYTISGLVYLYISLRFSSHDLFSLITINKNK